MAGYKFNYQLEEWMQNFTSYHMFLEFSSDASAITILNRKPLRNDKLDEERETDEDRDRDLEIDDDFKTVPSQSSCYLSEI